MKNIKTLEDGNPLYYLIMIVRIKLVCLEAETQKEFFIRPQRKKGANRLGRD